MTVTRHFQNIVSMGLIHGCVMAIGLGASAPALAQDEAGAGAGTATANSQVPQAAQAVGLDEIVVTAQRQSQNLQRVPVSVTALGGETIERLKIANITSLNTLVPNLNVSVQPAGSTVPTLTIRGVTGGQASPGADNGISLYVDGVYTGAGYGAISDLADIERIEVLRGPQGTLYGRNSTGGAINFITRGPSGQFGLRQEFSVGNRGRFRAKTRLDLPEWNGFSAVISYLHDEHRGWARNLGVGTRWDFTDITDGKIGRWRLCAGHLCGAACRGRQSAAAVAYPARCGEQ